jgi:pimeloyl-ACP methyl ester carboxylesterase
MDQRNIPSLGYMWRWSDKGHICFATGETVMDCPNKLICIGGLTDGLLACPWVTLLAEECKKINWVLIQPLLSSSYAGYGTSSLHSDTQELSMLVDHLSTKWNCQRIAIVGHSTGCQNAIHFAKHGSKEAVNKLVAICLQGPVSDQESVSQDPAYMHNLAIAQRLREENGISKCSQILMPFESHYTPITVYRFLSLFEPYGDDDFFSSYMSDHELLTRLEHLRNIGVKGSDEDVEQYSNVLVAISEQDQYMPSNIDKYTLLSRLTNAIGKRAKGLMIPMADHALYLPEDGSSIRIFVRSCVSILVNSLVH